MKDESETGREPKCAQIVPSESPDNLTVRKAFFSKTRRQLQQELAAAISAIREEKGKASFGDRL